jgi:Mce-associated membrane protein
VDDVESPVEPKIRELTPASPVPDEPAASTHHSIGLVGGIGLALIVVLLAALIVTKVQLNNQDSLNADRSSAIKAAKTYAADVASYNYKTLSADFGRVEAESTPQFRASFEKSSEALAKVLTQYKASATAVAIDAGVSSISSSQAVVLVFINQTVNNTTQKSVSTDESRVKVTLERSGGKWLLAHLTLPT